MLQQRAKAAEAPSDDDDDYPVRVEHIAKLAGTRGPARSPTAPAAHCAGCPLPLPPMRWLPAALAADALDVPSEPCPCPEHRIWKMHTLPATRTTVKMTPG